MGGRVKHLIPTYLSGTLAWLKILPLCFLSRVISIRIFRNGMLVLPQLSLGCLKKRRILIQIYQNGVWIRVYHFYLCLVMLISLIATSLIGMLVFLRLSLICFT